MEEELKMEALAQEIFDFYDANKNGTLEMKEMKNIIAHIAKRLKVPTPNDEEIEKGFHDLDVNKDGVIQFREFLPFYKSVYSQLKNIKGK